MDAATVDEGRAVVERLASLLDENRLAIVARPIAGEDEIGRKMHDAATVAGRAIRQRGGTHDIDRPRHCRVELARFQGTVADRVENAAKAMTIEEGFQSVGVLRILHDDAGPHESKRLPRPSAEHLSGVALAQGAKRVVSSHAGDASDQERKTLRKHRVMI